MRYSPQYASNINYNDENIGDSVNTTSLGLQINNCLKWKNRIDQMIPMLNRSCYAVSLMFHICSTVTFFFFHSVIKYGIILWGNSSNSKIILNL